MTGAPEATPASPGAAEREPAGVSAGLDVLVVAYHSGAVLGKSLRALSAFVPDGTRILVLDNSPDDPSAAAAVAATPGAELLPQAGNVGFAVAVNDGLRHGTGELVLLLNPDIF